MSSSLSNPATRTDKAKSRPRQARRFSVHSIFSLIHPITRRFRMRRFEQLLNPSSTMRIIDVGGTEYNWKFVAAQPRIVLFNVAYSQPESSDQFERVIGDGRNMPYEDGSFDIAFSNSVIEHVGDFDDQRRFANELRRVSKQLFVQTPAQESPLEPHYLTLFVHWLPVKWRRRLVRHFSLWGWFQRPTPAEVDEMVHEIRLLNRAEMEQLFPDCEIRTERFLFIPRSHIAIRR